MQLFIYDVRLYYMLLIMIDHYYIYIYINIILDGQPPHMDLCLLYMLICLTSGPGLESEKRLAGQSTTRPKQHVSFVLNH